MAGQRTKKKPQGFRISVNVKGGEFNIGLKQILAGFAAAAGLFGMHGANANQVKPSAAPQAIVQTAPVQTAPAPTIIVIYNNGNNGEAQRPTVVAPKAIHSSLHK